MYIEEFDMYISLGEWLEYSKDGCVECGIDLSNPEDVGLVDVDGSLICLNCQ